MTRRSLIQAAAAAACVGAMPMLGVRSQARADAAQAQPGLVSSEFIYETAPFPSCHASTIVETKAGLVAAWFGGTRERAPDVGIWVSRHEGGKWTAPVEVVNSTQADGSRIPSWNPVLFQPTIGPLLLFYKVGPSPSAWWGMLKTSTDNGRAWSDAQRLPNGILGPIKNKPVELADGALLCPSSTEGLPEEPKWRVHFERTTDLGKNWTTSAPKTSDAGDTPINAIQPSILRHGGDQLQAIGRTRSGRLFETWSQDNGKTWTPLRLTELPNPNSGTDAVTLRDGRQLLVYNHNDKPKGRTPLNVAVSKDGKTWEAALVLESEPGEYSYPAVIQSADGLVHATYTWKRKRVKHAVIDPAKLQPKPMSHGQWPDATTTK
jgi:predicted neuraminidase